jgi:hypothetical protein
VENQHRKISGYRELSEAEIEAMNAIKAMAEVVGEMVAELQSLPGVDHRALSIARTELQTGFMWATRAVAQPTTF